MVACDSGFLNYASMFGFASRIAMGHARNRAQFLGVDAIQLAVTDGRRWSNTSGTASDIENWRRAGGIDIICLTPTRRRRPRRLAANRRTGLPSRCVR